MNTPEHNNFTILRLLLALLVVLGHFRTLPGMVPAAGLFGFADFAVDTFFVVSGYLIYASYDHRPALGGFYIRRLFRIYPLYMAVVLIQGLLMAALAGGIAAHGAQLARYLALNFAMANFLAYDVGGLLGGLHNPGINPSLWTLKIELAFYLILPLLWHLTQRFGWRFLLLLYCASAAYAALMLHFGLEPLSRQLPGQLRFFAVGMALCRYHRHIHLSALAGIVLAVGLFWLSKTDAGLDLLLFPLCAGITMFTVAFRLPLMLLPFDISYGVYLTHGPLIQFSLLLGIFADSPSFLLLLLAAVLLLALIAERSIEQPGIELGKRLARSWNARFGGVRA